MVHVVPVTCSNDMVGFQNNECSVCCDVGCDQCRGPGCGRQSYTGLSANACCADNILGNEELCSLTQTARCVLDLVLAFHHKKKVLACGFEVEPSGGYVCALCAIRYVRMETKTALLSRSRLFHLFAAHVRGFPNSHPQQRFGRLRERRRHHLL